MMAPGRILTSKDSASSHIHSSKWHRKPSKTMWNSSKNKRSFRTVVCSFRQLTSEYFRGRRCRRHERKKAKKGISNFSVKRKFHPQQSCNTPEPATRDQRQTLTLLELCNIQEDRTELEKKFNRNTKELHELAKAGRAGNAAIHAMETTKKYILTSVSFLKHSTTKRIEGVQNQNNLTHQSNKSKCDCVSRRQQNGRSWNESWAAVVHVPRYSASDFGSRYDHGCDGIGYDGHMSCILAA